MEYCNQHIGVAERLSAIHTSVLNIEKTLTEDATFKRGVFIAFIGLTFIILAQIASFAYLIGQMNKQISINTERLTILEDMARYVKP